VALAALAGVGGPLGKKVPVPDGAVASQGVQVPVAAFQTPVAELVG